MRTASGRWQQAPERLEAPRRAKSMTVGSLRCLKRIEAPSYDEASM